jgi:hypothetical protein
MALVRSSEQCCSLDQREIKEKICKIVDDQVSGKTETWFFPG